MEAKLLTTVVLTGLAAGLITLALLAHQFITGPLAQILNTLPK